MAVYTQLTHAEMAEFASNYSIGELESFLPIEKGIENSNYLIIAGGRKYIFTIFENRVENADLPFFIRLTDHLQKKGINCPTTIPDRNGNQLNEVKGKKAAIISFLEGGDVENIEDFHLSGLGDIVARMHVAVSDFRESRKNAFGLSKWVELLGKVAERADELKPGLAQFIAREIEFLAANWPFGLPAGVVHTDLFPDNVFFKDGKVSGVIDFYFSSTDYFAYDIAICLNAWGAETNEKRQELFFDAYEKVRRLSTEEKSAMPVLLRGAALRFLMTRLYDWFNTPETALVKKKDPMEYYKKLEILS
jgi:homoserine kinase type II